MSKTKTNTKTKTKSATERTFDEEVESRVHDNRAPQKAENIDKTPRKLSTGGSFHDFKTEPIFEGVYTGNAVTASEDNPKRQQKKGDVIGYEFTSSEDDKTVIIGNSHSIRKSIEQVDAGAHLRITFEGQVKGKTGQPFNKFDVELLGYVKL